MPLPLPEVSIPFGRYVSGMMHGRFPPWSSGAAQECLENALSEDGFEPHCELVIRTGRIVPSCPMGRRSRAPADTE